MINSHATHQTTCTASKMPCFLERTSASSRYVNDSSKRQGRTQKIVQLEDVVYIEGTVSVAF